MSPTESLRALRLVNPRSRPGFHESIEEYDELRTQIASTAYTAPRRSSPIARKRRLIGVSMAGALLSTAAVLAAVVMLTGGSTESAYAAANKAVAATSASAVDSGTVVTTLAIDGDVLSTNTTRWHGSDISYATMTPSTASELRLVGDDAYEQLSAGRAWTHYKNGDHGLPGFMQVVRASARADVAGTTGRNIIDATSDLERVENPDGSITYTGTARADTIIGQYGVAGVVHAVRPIVKADEKTKVVDIELTVASNGLISRWRTIWESGGRAWVHTDSYSQLGSTRAITAPAASSVVESALAKPHNEGTKTGATTKTG